jgi:predicted esterase
VSGAFRENQLVIAAVVLSAAVLAIAAGPAGSAFYVPPSPLPGAQHGDAIWARPLTGGAVLPSAARNVLVLYRTTTPDGKSAAVSGMVAVPKGKPPTGGWPVISWAHGTTGDAPSCTPSLDAVDQPEHDYLGPIDSVLDGFVKRGYAVVQTDYQGEGTPGVQPYLDGTSEGRDVIDMVRAARQVEPSLSTRWVAMGHSQGGHAALFATALAPAWAPELQNLGGVAMAPATHLPNLIGILLKQKTPSPAFAVFALFVAGDAAVRPAEIFAPSALALLPQLQLRCYDGGLNGSDSFGGIVPASAFRTGADLTALLRDATADEPGPLSYGAPLLLLQGTDDTTVLPVVTDLLFTQFCKTGAIVRYDKYAGRTHRSLIPAATEDAAAWIAARFAGTPSPTTCGGAPTMHFALSFAASPRFPRTVQPFYGNT